MATVQGFFFMEDCRILDGILLLPERKRVGIKKEKQGVIFA